MPGHEAVVREAERGLAREHAAPLAVERTDDRHRVPEEPAGVLRHQHPLLRWGIKPYLLAADAVACLLSFLLVAQWKVGPAAVLVLVLVGLWVAGLYRPRLTYSLLDDAPFLLAPVALGGSDALRAAQRRSHGPLRLG
jgi:hypothetical protein